MFGFVLARKRKLLRVMDECASMKTQIAFTHSIIQQIENKKWSLAIEQLRTQQNTALSEGLVRMIQNLMSFSVQEDNRTWANKGLLEISKLINQRHKDLDTLADAIVRTLVNYIQANQGALFVINEENPTDAFIEMRACYAYDKKKYLRKRIELNEGLAGQCHMEGEVIYITAIPANFIKITSGLGEALPSCLVILPLKTNDVALGVIELAFFRSLLPFELKFLEAASEMIANTIADIQVAEVTKELLRKSEVQTQQLKNQEEELRQNLEEMTSLQEELQRRNRIQEIAMQEIEAKKKEIERMQAREAELIESKLTTQQIIHDKITDKLKRKIEMLQSSADAKPINNLAKDYYDTKTN